MPLTEREKEITAAVAEAMGQNSGLYYHGLLSDPLVVGLLNSNRFPYQCAYELLRNVGRKLGSLKQPSIGEIVHEAVARGEIGMQISMPSPIKPQLTEAEQRFLEYAAIVLLPKGGHFKGYRGRISELTGMTLLAINNLFRNLIYKFNSDNIEQAVVAAFAVGILDSDRLFGSEFPKPLIAIMDSEPYRRATQNISIGVYGKRLTDDEKKVSIALIERIGLNGGLFWRGWVQDVAVASGWNHDYIDGNLYTLSKKFGILNRKGEMSYQASLLLEQPVIARLPPRIEAEFNELEFAVMQESARVLLPAGGYYKGFREDVSQRIHYSTDHYLLIAMNVVRKTGTANLGQAVTYFIAHELTLISRLSLDPQRTPALEAIVTAMKNQRYFPKRPYLFTLPKKSKIKLYK